MRFKLGGKSVGVRERGVWLDPRVRMPSFKDARRTPSPFPHLPPVFVSSVSTDVRFPDTSYVGPVGTPIQLITKMVLRSQRSCDRRASHATSGNLENRPE